MPTPVKFPQLSQNELTRILEPPKNRKKPLRVVMDTDFNNEVDDHFALAWLLLQSSHQACELNHVKVEAVYAAPFSFKTRLDSLVKAYEIYLKPVCDRTPAEREFLAPYEDRIVAILALGITPFDLEKDPHLNGGSDYGVNSSYDSIIEMFKLSGVPSENKVYKGATEFMPSAYEPVRSEAAEHLVELALTASPDDPIYVIAIACVTDIASALLMEPKILPNIVVIWDAGFPTNVENHANDSLNLDEDLFASQLLFSSGVPLVYVPGFYIAQQLNMSQPDVTDWFKDSGKVGHALYERYLHNPLFSFYGIDPNNLFGRNWVIWDLANVAWLLNPDSLPSDLVRAPILTDEKKWLGNPEGHLIREAYQISVNSIFPEFAKQLRDNQ